MNERELKRRRRKYWKEDKRAHREEHWKQWFDEHHKANADKVVAGGGTAPMRAAERRYSAKRAKDWDQEMAAVRYEWNKGDQEEEFRVVLERRKKEFDAETERVLAERQQRREQMLRDELDDQFARYWEPLWAERSVAIKALPLQEFGVDSPHLSAQQRRGEKKTRKSDVGKKNETTTTDGAEKSTTNAEQLTAKQQKRVSIRCVSPSGSEHDLAPRDANDAERDVAAGSDTTASSGSAASSDALSNSNDGSDRVARLRVAIEQTRRKRDEYRELYESEKQRHKELMMIQVATLSTN